MRHQCFGSHVPNLGLVQFRSQIPYFFRSDRLPRQVILNRLRTVRAKFFIKVPQSRPQNLQLLLSQVFLLSIGLLCALRASVVNPLHQLLDGSRLTRRRDLVVMDRYSPDSVADKHRPLAQVRSRSMLSLAVTATGTTF